MKALRISTLCLLGVLGVTSMASAQVWSRRYNGAGSGNDSARAISVNIAGNVYITGESDGTAATKVDFTTIKYAPNGSPLWSKRYDGPAHGNDSGRGLVVDASGNVYVTGASEGIGTGSDIATVKYAPDGTRLWVKRYDGPAHGLDIPSSMAIDPSDGSIYVAGGSASVATQQDYVLIKYAPDGTRRWVKRYDGSDHGYDFVRAVTVDSSHNVIVTGASTGRGTEIDFATVKYNASGTQLFVRRYNSPKNLIDFAHALAVDRDGNIYVTGNSWRSDTESHYVTIKYDSLGAQQWLADGNHAGGVDIPWGIAVDPSGNAIVTGQSADPTTQNDYLTIKYQGSTGATMWATRYDGIGNDDFAYALALDVNGGIYVTGTSYTGTTNKFDILTIQYMPNGVMNWHKAYAGAGRLTDAGYAIVADLFGHCYVAGVATTVGLATLVLTDFVTIKY